MNTYKCSNGDRITKAEIDRKVREAKRQLIENQINDYGFNFCEECALNGQSIDADPMKLKILDCSHILSVDKCQKAGKTEFAWDVRNLEVLCRYHHEQWDKLNLDFKE